MAFTLRQIEVFVEAAKDQNFRRTADRLNISQPAISRHVRLLEEHAGGPLFLRQRGSNARLSPLGHTMLAEARGLLRSARRVRGGPDRAEMGDLTLRIAAGAYLLDRWLRPNVRGVVNQHDGLHLEFVVADRHEDLLQMVRDGEVDCAFYTGEPLAMPGLDFALLKRVSVGIYAAPALAAQAGHVPQDVAALPFALANRGTPVEAWQVATLAAVGVSPQQVVVRSQFMEVLIDCVADGTAAALLFDSDAAPLVKQGLLVRLPFALPQGARILVQRHDHARNDRRDGVIGQISGLLQRD